MFSRDTVPIKSINVHLRYLEGAIPNTIYTSHDLKKSGWIYLSPHHLFAKLRNEVPLLVSFDHAWMNFGHRQQRRGWLKPLQVAKHIPFPNTNVPGSSRYVKYLPFARFFG